jgi:hypothetical protein
MNSDTKTYEGFRICTTCHHMKEYALFKKTHRHTLRFKCLKCYNIDKIKHNKTYYQRKKEKLEAERIKLGLPKKKRGRPKKNNSI